MKILGFSLSGMRLSLLMALAVSTAGCNTAPTRDPEFAPVRPRPTIAPAPQNGAIYQAGYNIVLFEDIRARRVGDILTVTLNEQTDASKSAETTMDKDTTTTVTNPTLFGSAVQFNAPAFLPLASTTDNTLETTLGTSHAFDGSGESTQSNRLTGDITVTVAEVLPNGDLVVQGEKLLTLNQGHEHIRLSGTVRQTDISADNSVSSTKIANARIVYAGQGGPVADSNVLGWLARFFVSAFFPF